jgi:hypothetical protein
LAVIRLYHSGVIKLSPWVGRGKPGGYHQKVILCSSQATADDEIDFPASLSFGIGKGARKSVFVTNYPIGRGHTTLIFIIHKSGTISPYIVMEHLICAGI